MVKDTVFGFEGFKETVYNEVTFLDSSMVEHAAVNRGVVGSSPTRGVFLNRKIFRVGIGPKNKAPWSRG